LAVTAVDRKHCPAPATACVDLARHMTWLQAGGKVSFDSRFAGDMECKPFNGE